MSELLRKIFVYAFIFLISAFVLFPSTSLERTPVHADEPGWIAAGYIHTEMLIHLLTNPEFDRNLWQQRDSYFHMNGQIGKWLVGFPVWIYFHLTHHPKIMAHQNLTIASFSSFTKSLWDEVHQNDISTKKIIRISRMSSLFFGILCCFFIYGIGLLCSSPPVGFISVLLLLINPLFVDAASRSMTDIFYLFFLLCALFSLILFRKKQVLLPLAFGICSALAASVKITGILVGTLILLSYLGFKERLRLNRYPAPILLFALSAITVIYLLNPFLWISFSAFNSKGFLAETKIFMGHVNQKIKGENVSIQIRNYPQLEPFLKFPYIFLEWNYVMKEQQENIASGKWKLNPQRFGMTREEQVLKKNGIKRLQNIIKMFVMLLTPFPLIGLAFLILGLVQSVHSYSTNHQDERVLLPILFFASNLIFIILSLKLNWDRYYLTAIVTAQVVIANGILEASKKFLSLANFRKSKSV